MRLFVTINASVGLAAILLSLGAGDGQAASPVDAELRRLAGRAANREGWPLLRRYANTAKDSEQRGLAYFLLGYREYEAEEFPAASHDLRDAARTPKFLLEDFAEYFGAAAADNAGQTAEAPKVLEDFHKRFPDSPLRLQALELLAKAFLESGDSERAVAALTAEPQVRQLPSLALLLAEAYSRSQKLDESARTFQEIYYAFPTSPEAAAAAEALQGLEQRLGGRFPRASEELETARADILFKQSKTAKALEEYEKLLKARSSSLLVPRWKLAQAKCRLSLRRPLAAIEALQGFFSHNAELDAERLATLVEAEGQGGDTELMLHELGQLGSQYPRSPSYAFALSWVASYYARQGNWKESARYSITLAGLFPSDELGREASWHAAWCAYLTRPDDGAREALLDHLRRYPTSPHFAAAVYWMGRMAEERKSEGEARVLYGLLIRRFAHRYYAVLARGRLERLPPEGREPGSAYPVFGAVEQLVPRSESPPLAACASLEPAEIPRAFVALEALGLDNLAEEYLDGWLKSHAASPELLFTLIRVRTQEHEFQEAVRDANKLVPNYPDHEFSELPVELWDILYPRPYLALINQQARANALDPFLVLALVREESAFDPLATSWANARGLMQILPQTASAGRRVRAATAQRLYDPAYNVRLGCRYLSALIKRYDGNVEQALAAYHAGKPRVEAWLQGNEFHEPAEFLETIPIPATRAYVGAVLRDRDIYRQLLSGLAMFKKCS